MKSKKLKSKISLKKETIMSLQNENQILGGIPFTASLLTKCDNWTDSMHTYLFGSRCIWCN